MAIIKIAIIIAFTRIIKPTSKVQNIECLKVKTHYSNYYNISTLYPYKFLLIFLANLHNLLIKW